MPLLESMHFGVPIVAFGVTAVPETLADAGICLPDKSPALVAEAVDRALSDEGLRAQLVAAGARRLQRLHARAKPRPLPRSDGAGAVMKLAFVTPRYGADVIGGAELGARLLAERLAAVDGWSVEILTTCARDAWTWANDYAPGSTVEQGVTVRRFLNRAERDADFRRLTLSLLAHPERVSDTDAYDWIDRQGPVSPDLIEAIRESDHDLVAFTPYLYHPTVAGLPAIRERAVLHPAAHDEPAIRLRLFEDVFERCEGPGVLHRGRARDHRGAVSRRRREASGRGRPRHRSTTCGQRPTRHRGARVAALPARARASGPQQGNAPARVVLRRGTSNADPGRSPSPSSVRCSGRCRAIPTSCRSARSTRRRSGRCCAERPRWSRRPPSSRSRSCSSNHGRPVDPCWSTRAARPRSSTSRGPAEGSRSTPTPCSRPRSTGFCSTTHCSSHSPLAGARYAEQYRWPVVIDRYRRFAERLASTLPADA